MFPGAGQKKFANLKFTKKGGLCLIISTEIVKECEDFGSLRRRPDGHRTCLEMKAD